MRLLNGSWAKTLVCLFLYWFSLYVLQMITLRGLHVLSFSSLFSKKCRNSLNQQVPTVCTFLVQGPITRFKYSGVSLIYDANFV